MNFEPAPEFEFQHYHVPVTWRARIARLLARLRTELEARRRLLRPAAAAAAVVLLLVLVSSGYRYRPLAAAIANPAPPAPSADAKTPARDLAQLRRERHRLRAALDRKLPRGKYIVVDRINNRVYLRERNRLVRVAISSTGSGFILREPSGRKRTWIFDTPQGVYHVLSKMEDPVWIKPDWAFVEEGRSIPRDPSDRVEYGTLGEYALYFGDGYMLHGTLYERLLGRNITHGCIRLGRDDLRAIYRAAGIGTPVYIY
jgi:L,D-transpeptidase YbiS